MLAQTLELQRPCQASAKRKTDAFKQSRDDGELSKLVGEGDSRPAAPCDYLQEKRRFLQSGSVRIARWVEVDEVLVTIRERVVL